MQQQTVSLLPSFESVELHALSHLNNDSRQVMSEELKAVSDLDNPLLCDAKFLPHLAYANSADLWSDILHDDEKRQLIAKSKELHRYKGTVWAILEVLKAIGLSTDENEATVLEYRDRDSEDAVYQVKRDGSYFYDATVKHNDGVFIHPFTFTEWTEFAVVLKAPVTEVKAALARRFVEMYKPARSKLLGFTYETLRARDGSIYYDATYTHGLTN